MSLLNPEQTKQQVLPVHRSTFFYWPDIAFYIKNSGKGDRMRKALIRFEDVGPGGYYGSEESLAKLRVMADYLHSEEVPFHVSMIPRFVDPTTGYDKSIADTHDPVVRSFLATMRYLQDRGASLGMHGYRHQYGNSVSADGYEFTHTDSAFDSPPDDSESAVLEQKAFEHSYTSGRMRDGFAAIKQSGLQVDWFSTPHYTASPNQRSILESWIGLFFENKPGELSSHLILTDVDSPLHRGVIYIPTPLFYVEGSKADEEIQRILHEAKGYTREDLAGFFFHPYLDFPFLTGQGSSLIYDDNAYLKKLIRGFKQQSFRFVPLLSLVPFVPSFRQTEFFPGTQFHFFTGDFDGDGRDELLIWHPARGDFHLAKGNLGNYPSRQHERFRVPAVLLGWKPCGDDPCTLLIGDFNGDGKDDLALWHPSAGRLHLALCDGSYFYHAPSQLFEKDGLGASDRMPFVGDFNGDAKDEIAFWHPSTGEWWVEGKMWIAGFAVGGSWLVCVGDWNGDGRDDLIAWNRETGKWQVAFSTGTRFHLALASDQLLRPLRNWISPDNGWQLHAADFDGDGLDDLLMVNPARGDWRVALATGTGFIPFEQAFHPWAAGVYTQPLVGKFTQDGRATLCSRHPFLRGGVVDFAVSVLGMAGTTKQGPTSSG